VTDAVLHTSSLSVFTERPANHYFVCLPRPHPQLFHSAPALTCVRLELTEARTNEEMRLALTSDFVSLCVSPPQRRSQVCVCPSPQPRAAPSKKQRGGRTTGEAHHGHRFCGLFPRPQQPPSGYRLPPDPPHLQQFGHMKAPSTATNGLHHPRRDATRKRRTPNAAHPLPTRLLSLASSGF
jgi:hypothetical protein